MYIFSFDRKQDSKCSFAQAIFNMWPLKSLRTERDKNCVWEGYGQMHIGEHQWSTFCWCECITRSIRVNSVRNSQLFIPTRISKVIRRRSRGSGVADREITKPKSKQDAMKSFLNVTGMSAGISCWLLHTKSPQKSMYGKP